ncbi:MAG: hypothetical protein MI921_00170 [Cytophagales bacterium]|nr:hypothetical protein [Cytophagales bacterium]
MTPNSQRIIEKLDGDLTITTYVNLFGTYYFFGAPTKINEDIKRYQQYTRFKPEIKLDYVHYWDKAIDNERIYKSYPDMTDEEIAKKRSNVYGYAFDFFAKPEAVKAVGLSDEDNRFVSLAERESHHLAQASLGCLFSSVKTSVSLGVLVPPW